MSRKILLVVFLCMVLGALSAQTSNMLKFDSRLIDLGEVKTGERVDMEFHFENISNEAVSIDLVSACECTEIDWPVKSFAPGEKGSLKAVFDSSKKEKDEIIDIDIFLKNTDNDGVPLFEVVQYSYKLVN